MTEQEKESGLVVYSILAGIILTFTSLVYHWREPFWYADSYGASFPFGLGHSYGFPFSWIVFESSPMLLLGPFDPFGFLFDVFVWAVISYVVLRLASPIFTKYMKSKYSHHVDKQ